MNATRSDRRRQRARALARPAPGAPRIRLLEPGELPWAGGLFLLAWIHRLAFLFSNPDRDWGFSLFYEGDAETFHDFARAILAGARYDGGVPFHPPGFPYLLAAVYALLGAGSSGAGPPHLGVKIVMTLIGSLPVALIFLLARPYLGHRIALAGAALSLYGFGQYVLSVSPVSEGLYVTLLLVALLVWTRTMPHPLTPLGMAFPSRPTARPRGRTLRIWGLALGLVLGVVALTRAEGTLIGIALVGIGLGGALALGDPVEGATRSGSRMRRALPWLFVTLGWMIAITPWAVHNRTCLSDVNRQMGERLAEPLPTFVPITAYGPLNLALANHDGADGTFSRRLLHDPAGSGDLNLTDPTHLRYFLHGDEIAWRWIRENPGAFATLVARKWALMFESLKLGWTQWDAPGGLSGIRRPVDVFVPRSWIGLLIVAPLIAIGLGLCLRRPGPARRWGWIVLLVTGCAMATAGLFFGYARVGVVLEPLWYTLVAAAVLRITRLDRIVLPGRGTARALAVVVVALLALELWGVTRNRDYVATGTMLSGGGHLNPHAIMSIEPKAR